MRSLVSLKDGRFVLVGTINGLDTLSFSPFELFDFNNSGVDNDVLAFEQDHRGRIWVGTYSGLYFFDQSENSHSRFELATNTYALENKRIGTISAKNDDLWLGLLQNGAKVVDSTTGNYWTPKINHSREMTITKILLGIDEEQTWIASYNHGLFLVTSEGTHSYLENQSLPEKSITGLFRSKAGILLAVSEEKIYLYDSANDQFVEQTI